MIPGKLKIEVTKDPIHHVGKNGAFLWGNLIYEYPPKRHTKSNQHMGILHLFSKSNQHMGILHAFSKPNQHMCILHAFSNCLRETFNHGLSPSEDDWGDPKGETTKLLKYTSSGNMLMEVDWRGNLKLNCTSSGNMLIEADWRGKLKHNYTSSESMLMEVDWGGELIINSMLDWGVDWGGNDAIPNHMNEFLLSEVDCRAHESSFFLFLANIHYDAKLKEYFIQGLWGELQQSISYTLLIGYLTDSSYAGKIKDDAFNPKPDPELDDSEQPTGKVIQSYLSLIGQLQWLVTLGRLVIHAQVTTLPIFRSTRRKPQRIYGCVKNH